MRPGRSSGSPDDEGQARQEPEFRPCYEIVRGEYERAFRTAQGLYLERPHPGIAALASAREFTSRGPRTGEIVLYAVSTR